MLEVDDVASTFLGQGREQVDIPEITKADAGGARTILLLGSDARYEDKKLGLKPRSDTMLLVRADPDQDAIAVMSIPRDLAVEIPGHGRDKINAAFENGGERLTVRTIKKLFEDATGDDFPINNVISVEFGSFRRAVDYIGGVYVDIDRDYFNDNSGGGERYAAIDVDAGYQKLKGQDALDYVRYRHTDNDFIRAARQQDFLRQARSQSGDQEALPGRQAQEARARVRPLLHGRQELPLQQGDLLDAPARAVPGAAEPERQRGPLPRRRVRQPGRRHAAVRVRRGPQEDRRRVHEREELRQADRDLQADAREDQESQRLRRKRNRNKSAAVPGLEEAGAGRRPGRARRPQAQVPVLLPDAAHRRGAAYAGTEPRVYTIRDEQGKKHEAYRLVVSKGLAGEYYGIQGMTWKDPPILDNPDEMRDVRRPQAPALLRRPPAAAGRVEDARAPSTGCRTRSRSRSTSARCSRSPSHSRGSSSSGASIP